MPNEEVVIIIRGPHDSGRSTLARIIEAALLENGYLAVEVEDTAPLPKDRKAPLVDRWSRNRETRKHRIKVETVE